MDNGVDNADPYGVDDEHGEDDDDVDSADAAVNSGGFEKTFCQVRSITMTRRLLQSPIPSNDILRIQSFGTCSDANIEST